jgi:hypothetical protein
MRGVGLDEGLECLAQSAKLFLAVLIAVEALDTAKWGAWDRYGYILKLQQITRTCDG